MSRHLASLGVIAIAMLTAMATSPAPLWINAEIAVSDASFVVTNRDEVTWEEAWVAVERCRSRQTSEPFHAHAEIGSLRPGEQKVVPIVSLTSDEGPVDLNELSNLCVGVEATVEGRTGYSPLMPIPIVE